MEDIHVAYRVRDLSWMPDGRLTLLSNEGAVHFLSLASESEYCCEQVKKVDKSLYTLGCGLR